MVSTQTPNEVIQTESENENGSEVVSAASGTVGANASLMNQLEHQTQSQLQSQSQPGSSMDDILTRIRAHLAKWEAIDQTDLTYTDDDTEMNTHLHLPGGNTISSLCMLHYLSGQAQDFLADQADISDCSGRITTYLENGGINLTRLIDLSLINNNGNNGSDLEFYQNLYRFNIEMVRYIASSPEFKAASIATQEQTVENLRQFTRQSLSYLQSFMRKHQVIDDKLLASSYDLMYLLHILSMRQANIGRSYTELQAIYQRITEAIQKNLNLFDQFDVDAATSSGVGTPNAEVAALYNRLSMRLDDLNNQYNQLTSNLSTLDNNTEGLIQHVSPQVRSIAERFDGTSAGTVAETASQ